MSTTSPTVAIVGATGLVGRELIELLHERRFGFKELRLFASPRSAPTTIGAASGALRVEALTEENESAFDGVDVAFFTATGAVSRSFVPRAIEAGAVVIDNSSAYRMHEEVPLVVPEINGALLKERPRLIANPNCSTVLLLMAIQPIRRLFGVRRVIVSTYQAVSGAGAAALAELDRLAAAATAGRPLVPEVFPEPCAFNVFSHESALDPVTGDNEEEHKVLMESRKILGDAGLAIRATCVRVPVRRAHTQSVYLTLERPLRLPEDLDRLRAEIEAAPGLALLDDRAGNRFPTPLAATGRDEVIVGRLRPDDSESDPATGAPLGLSLMLSGDQLRKGAALNALQIAECLFESTLTGARR